MRKMRKAKGLMKGMAAPSAKKTDAPTPKRPAKEDVPGHLRGGKQPVKTPKGGMSRHMKKLRGVMI